jgi:hypothetical protein
MWQNIIIVVLVVSQAANAVPQGPGKGSGGSAGGRLGAFFGGGSSSTVKADPNDDYPTMMCKNHPPGGKLSATEAMFGSPNGSGPDEQCIKDISGGSGPYKSNMTTEASLADHTIYAPIVPPPASEKLPIVIWNNGMCLKEGSRYTLAVKL